MVKQRGIGRTARIFAAVSGASDASGLAFPADCIHADNVNLTSPTEGDNGLRERRRHPPLV